MAQTGQIIENPVSGERIVFRKTASQTGGRLLSFDLYLASDGHVPASHVHPVVEERFTVVEGSLRFRRGLRHVVAKAGDTVIVPPGTLHRFANAGSGTVRALVEVRPALRMEELFETTMALAHEGRTLSTGMPKPLDMALFLREFEEEIRVPLVPAPLVRTVMAPLVSLARRRGLDRRYQRPDRLIA